MKTTLKKAFMVYFMCFIVLPFFILSLIVSSVLYVNSKKTALNNIKIIHDSMVREIETEVKDLSMQTAHLLYANNNEILKLASACDIADPNTRYLNTSKLNEMLSFCFPPSANILSIYFNFTSGRNVFYKVEMNFKDNKLKPANRAMDNVVITTSFNAGREENLYSGSNVHNMIYRAVVYPDTLLDREGNIESIELYQSSRIYSLIQKYDTAYELENNNLGYTVLLDSEDSSLLSYSRFPDEWLKDYIAGKPSHGVNYVTTKLDNQGILILTAVRTSDLFSGFGLIIVYLLLTFVLLSLFLTIFFISLSKNVINPIVSVSSGLRLVEHGNYDQHINARGFSEVSEIIHSFNAMIRHIKALVTDYEEKVRTKTKNPGKLLNLLLSDSIGKEDREILDKMLFSREYKLIMLKIEDGKAYQQNNLFSTLDTNLQFASHCHISGFAPNTYLIYYYLDSAAVFSCDDLVGYIKETIKSIYELDCSMIISSLLHSPDDFDRSFQQLGADLRFLPLFNYGRLFDLNDKRFDLMILDHVEEFASFSNALYLADEKLIFDCKELFIKKIENSNLHEAQILISAFLIAFSEKLRQQATDLFSYIGYRIDYNEKIINSADIKTLILLFGNLISEMVDISIRNLDKSQMDRITLAKRYIADNYQRSSLSLSDVAQYVELNENYFSSNFKKETGESFMNYLLGIRLQNAKVLLKTTSFKVFEIADIVGFSSAEHFNRSFKKSEGITPLVYRKVNK